MNGVGEANAEDRETSQKTIAVIHSTNSESFDFNLRKNEAGLNMLKGGLSFCIYITRMGRKKNVFIFEK